MPRMPDWGALRIGVDISEPYTPPFEIVKVAPCRSSIFKAPSRARLPSSVIVCSISAIDL